MFKAQPWKYEPMSIARQRALSKFDMVRDQVSPLVASGDSLSLLRARDIARQAAIPDDVHAARQQSFMKKMGDAIRAHAASGLAAAADTGPLPPDVQAGMDRQTAMRNGTQGKPVPGVPLGVAEGHPDTVQGNTRIYKSGSSNGATHVNLGASLVDDERGLPTIVKHALHTPVLGPVLTEAARPANWALPFAMKGVSEAVGAIPVAGRVLGPLAAPALDREGASATQRIGAQIGASAGAPLLGHALKNLVPDGAPGPVKTGADILGNIAGYGLGAKIGGGGFGGMPVGASIKEVGGHAADDLVNAGEMDVRDAKDELLRYVSSEAKQINSGARAAGDRVGRAAQFKGGRQAFNDASRAGLPPTDVYRAARSGMGGALPANVPEPMAISSQAREAIQNEIAANAANPDKDFPTYINTSEAFDKAVNGLRLSERDIRQLAPLLGHDLTTAIVNRNGKEPFQAKGVVQDVVTGRGPKLPGSGALPKSGPSVPGAGRGKSATDLYSMNPATKAAIGAEDQAKRDLLKSQQDLQARLKRSAPDFLGNPATPTTPEQFPTSGANGVPGASRVDPRPGEQAANDFQRFMADPIRTGRAQPAVAEVMDHWDAGNRIMLRNMRSEGSDLIANINAQVTGNVADSYLSAALSRRNLLATSLRQTWHPVTTVEQIAERDKLITQMTTAAFERELRIHYKGEVPESARQVLATARALPYQESLGAVSQLVQRAKNSTFGVGDFGVMGVQIESALRHGGIPQLAFVINRMLSMAHMPHVETFDPASILSKAQQYGLEGVAQNANTGLFERTHGTQDVGSLFSYLGKPGRLIDRPFMAFADKLSHVQFGLMLGSMRNATYEGNLVLAHLAGRDTKDAAVKADAAASANAITSFANSALRKGRAQREGVLLNSDKMVRARFNNVIQMARVFNPRLQRFGGTVTPTQRLLGATAIASTVGYSLLVGKYLNDAIGVGDFEFDPSMPGWGQITLGNGHVIQTVPQGSVERAFSQSIREIVGNHDPVAASKAWTNMYLGSASIVGQGAAAATNTGFDQKTGGYKYGNLGGSATERLTNLVPVPPTMKSVMQNGFDPFSLSMGIAGQGEFKEGGEREAQRVFHAETGNDWKTATRDQRLQFTQAHPQIDAHIQQDALSGKSGESAQVKAEYKQQQQAADDGLVNGSMKREDWVNAYYDRLTAKAAVLAHAYGDKPITDPKDPVQRYVQIIQQSKDPKTGQLDHDKLDAGMAGLSEADRNYIADHVGLDETAISSQFRAAREVRRQRNELPLYRGYTGKQAQQIDDVWQEVRNNATSAAQLHMLRAYRQYIADNPGLDPAILKGVRARIAHGLPQLTLRAKFDKAHPDQKLFYGAGKLTADERAQLQAQS